MKAARRFREKDPFITMARVMCVIATCLHVFQ